MQIFPGLLNLIFLFSKFLSHSAPFYHLNLFLLFEFLFKDELSFLFSAEAPSLLLLSLLTLALSLSFWGVKKSWGRAGKEGWEGEGDGGGEGIPGRRGLPGRRRFLKDLKLSAGELGRLSSNCPSSLLTSLPGLRHLGNDFEVKNAILDQKFHKHWLNKILTAARQPFLHIQTHTCLPKLWNIWGLILWFFYFSFFFVKIHINKILPSFEANGVYQFWGCGKFKTCNAPKHFKRKTSASISVDWGIIMGVTSKNWQPINNQTKTWSRVQRHTCHRCYKAKEGEGHHLCRHCTPAKFWYIIQQQ